MQTLRTECLAATSQRAASHRRQLEAVEAIHVGICLKWWHQVSHAHYESNQSLLLSHHDLAVSIANVYHISVVIEQAADAHTLLHDSTLSMPMMQVCSVKDLELFPFQDACVTCSFEHPARA